MNDVYNWMWMAEVLGCGSPYSGEALAWAGGDAGGFCRRILAGERPHFLTRGARERAAALAPDDLAPRLADCRRLGAAGADPRTTRTTPNASGTCPDLPLVLYVTGSTACLNGGRYVAMVGHPPPHALRPACLPRAFAFAGGAGDGDRQRHGRRAGRRGPGRRRGGRRAHRGVFGHRHRQDLTRRQRRPAGRDRAHRRRRCQRISARLCGQDAGDLLARNRLIARWARCCAWPRPACAAAP